MVSSGYECIIHMHAIAAQIEISKVNAKIDKQAGKRLFVDFSSLERREYVR